MKMPRGGNFKKFLHIFWNKEILNAKFFPSGFHLEAKLLEMINNVCNFSYSKNIAKFEAYT